MKPSIHSRKMRFAKRPFSKGAFRSFNKQSSAWQHGQVVQLVEQLAQHGRIYLDNEERLVIIRPIHQQVVILELPWAELGPWCGNDPFRHPPLKWPPRRRPRHPWDPRNPDPGPDCGPRVPPRILKEYFKALLTKHSEGLYLASHGRSLHAISLGDKVQLRILGRR